MSKIEREMALLQVSAKSGQERLEVLELARIFRARVVDVSPITLTLEVMGQREELDDLVQILEPFGIGDIVRGATVAIERGSVVPD